MKAGRALDLAERRARVLEYFATNPRATFREAGRDLSIPKSTVKRDFDIAVADITARAADAYLATMIARNEAIVRAFMPAVELRASVQHAQAVLAADKRTADLLGLDAPKKVDIEQRIRVMADELGIDPDEAVSVADAYVRGLAVRSMKVGE